MGSARLREVDALRSFALGGILMVNIWYFADPFTLAGEISPNHRSAADLAVHGCSSLRSKVLPTLLLPVRLQL